MNKALCLIHRQGHCGKTLILKIHKMSYLRFDVSKRFFH